MMRRREFITLLGGAAAWPLAARAQQPDRMRRVGLLSSIAESDPEAQSMATGFHQALQGLGWVDGRNLRIVHRWAAGNLDRVEAFARELAGLQPEVIVAYTTPSVVALRRNTGTIPIVFVQVSDPIGTGFITNLAHPGGNITGFTNFESSMVGKWAEMLTEGGLMSYGVDQVELFRRAATYVDRILKGEKPADLPVQAPTKFELVINLRTAKALGLTVPLIMQMTANEVIE